MKWDTVDFVFQSIVVYADNTCKYGDLLYPFVERRGGGGGEREREREREPLYSLFTDGLYFQASSILSVESLTTNCQTSLCYKHSASWFMNTLPLSPPHPPPPPPLPVPSPSHPHPDPLVRSLWTRARVSTEKWKWKQPGNVPIFPDCSCRRLVLSVWRGKSLALYSWRG